MKSFFRVKPSFLRVLSVSALAALCLAGPARTQTAVTSGPMALAPEGIPPTYTPAPPGFGQQLSTTSGTQNALTVPDAKANFPAGSSFTIEGRVTPDGSHRAVLFTRGNTDAGQVGSIFLGLDDGGSLLVQVITASGPHGGNPFGGTTTGQPCTLAAVYKNGVGLTVYVNGISHFYADTDAWNPGTVTGTYLGRGYSGDPANPYQGTSTTRIDEVAISTVAQYAANYTPATSQFATTRKGQSALYHLDGSLADSNTNTDFTDVGGGGPVGPIPPTLTAPWPAPALAAAYGAWANVYNVTTDARLPHLLVGDGTTDNLANYVSDDQWVSLNGGGVLYFPAGTYAMQTAAGAAMTLNAGVVLEGDGADPVTGADKTTILYNPAGTPAAYGLLLYGSNVGLFNLAVKYGGPAETAPYQASNVGRGLEMFGGVNRDNFFLKNVHWVVGAGQGLNVGGNTNVAVEDCRLETSGNYLLGQFGQVNNLEIARTSAFYKEGRFGILYCNGGVVDGLNIYRAGGKHAVFASGGTSTSGNIDGGGVEASYSQNIVFRNCLTTTLTPTDPNFNDGECWLTQDVLLYFHDKGTLTGASGGTATDASKAWSTAAGAWDPRTYVVAVSGTHAGQYAPVTAHTATTFTSALALAAGDQYTLEVPSALNLTVDHCLFINNNKPLELDAGAFGCTVSNDTLVNSQGILLAAFDLPGGIHQPVIGCSVFGNSVSNPDGQKFSYVAIQSQQQDAAPHGLLATGNKVYANQVTPHPAGLVPVFNANRDTPAIAADGVYYQAANGGAQIVDPGTMKDTFIAGATNGVGPIPLEAATATALPASDVSAVVAAAGTDGKVTLSQAQRDAIQREVLRLTQTGGRLDPSNPEGQALLLLLATSFHALLPAFVTSAPAPGGH